MVDELQLGNLRSVKRKRSESPPPAEGLKNVCVCVRLFMTGGVKWLKLRIPGTLLDSLSSSGSSSGSGEIKVEGPFNFNCHVKSDPECERPYEFSARCAPVGSVMYALGGDQPHVQDILDIYDESMGMKPLQTTRTTGLGLSNCFDRCDFSKPEPQWEMGSQPLLSPRFLPKLVSLDGKLFAFGGTRPFDSDAPFAEVFDPQLGYWEPLPKPPFGWVCDRQLFVFPLVRLKRILLVAGDSGSYGYQYTYDPSTHCWHCLHSCPDLSPLLYGSVRIDGNPVVSVYDETLYWLDRSGRLSTYNLLEQNYQVARVTGLPNLFFGSEGRLNKHRVTALLPLSEYLLGIVWCSTHISKNGMTSTLELTILHLSSLEDMDDCTYLDDLDEFSTKPTILASMVDMIPFTIYDDAVKIIDAYFMDEDETDSY